MNKVQIIQFLVQFVVVLGNFISYAIIGRIIMSWLTMGKPGHPQGRFGQMLFDVTEPFINLARKVPHRWGMMDFAPLIALISIDLLSSLISTALINLL